jgi:hypothetical protein
MIIAVQGTKNFSDYSIFLRAMRTSLSAIKNDDKDIFIYSAGPAVINSQATEFANVSERGLRSRGYKIQVRKIPPAWIKDNIDFIDQFAFFSLPKEPVSDVVEWAQARDAEVLIYRY